MSDENEQLKQSTLHLTTTDIMNRKALLQYLSVLNTNVPGVTGESGSHVHPAHRIQLAQEAAQSESDGDDDDAWK
jgi:hypothetical protein